MYGASDTLTDFQNPGIFTELYYLYWTLLSTPSEYIKVLGYAFTQQNLI